jgi:hypothetical protein
VAQLLREVIDNVDRSAVRAAAEHEALFAKRGFCVENFTVAGSLLSRLAGRSEVAGSLSVGPGKAKADTSPAKDVAAAQVGTTKTRRQQRQSLRR